MKKCILLVRVSTEQQSYDEQEKQLYVRAIKDGYSDEEIEPIKEKESGIKLKEEDRNGLNRMKEVITNNKIECVYAWEISRIARTKKVLFSILEYLIEHKIQLKINEPNITLLNDDKTINEGSETVFTLFAQIAESEMRNKKARFARGKKSAGKDKKYIGGYLLYGYRVNEKGYLVLNEKQIEVVKYIFKTYLSTDCSVRSLANELTELGYISYKNESTARVFVSNVLHNYSYAACSDSLYKYDEVIIAKKDIDAAIEKCNKNISLSKSVIKHIYFCKSLIKSDCGHIYTAHSASINACYKCPICKKSNYININMIDSLVWYVAIILQTAATLHSSEKDIILYKNQIRVLNQKRNVCKKNIDKVLLSLDRLNERIVLGKISNEKANSLEHDLDKEKRDNENMIEKYVEQIFALETFIANAEHKDNIINIDNIAGIQDDKLRYDIIHEHIKQLLVEKIKDGLLKVIVTAKVGVEFTYYITTRNRKIYGSQFDINKAYTKSVENEVAYTYLERMKDEKKNEEAKIKNRVYYENNRERAIERASINRKRKTEREKALNNKTIKPI